MGLIDQCNSVRSREDFVAFATALAKDFRDNRDSWENASLDRFLEALAGWVNDMDGHYINKGVSPPQSDWNVLAEMLMAAKMYE